MANNRTQISSNNSISSKIITKEAIKVMIRTSNTTTRINSSNINSHSNNKRKASACKISMVVVLPKRPHISSSSLHTKRSISALRTTCGEVQPRRQALNPSSNTSRKRPFLCKITWKVALQIIIKDSSRHMIKINSTMTRINSITTMVNSSKTSNIMTRINSTMRSQQLSRLSQSTTMRMETRQQLTLRMLLLLLYQHIRRLRRRPSTTMTSWWVAPANLNAWCRVRLQV